MQIPGYNVLAQAFCVLISTVCHAKVLASNNCYSGNRYTLPRVALLIAPCWVRNIAWEENVVAHLPQGTVYRPPIPPNVRWIIVKHVVNKLEYFFRFAVRRKTKIRHTQMINSRRMNL